MNKKELVEKRLIDGLDAWVKRFRMNLIGKEEWEKNHRRVYDKIKEIIRDHCRGTPPDEGGNESLDNDTPNVKAVK